MDGSQRRFASLRAGLQGLKSRVAHNSSSSSSRAPATPEGDLGLALEEEDLSSLDSPATPVGSRTLGSFTATGSPQVQGVKFVDLSAFAPPASSPRRCCQVTTTPHQSSTLGP